MGELSFNDRDVRYGTNIEAKGFYAGITASERYPAGMPGTVFDHADFGLPAGKIVWS